MNALGVFVIAILLGQLVPAFAACAVAFITLDWAMLIPVNWNTPARVVIVIWELIWLVGVFAFTMDEL